MSQFELRCRAVDLLMTEAAPWLARGALGAAEAVIGAGLRDGLWGEALEVRLHALELVRTHRRRGGCALLADAGGGAG